MTRWIGYASLVAVTLTACSSTTELTSAPPPTAVVLTTSTLPATTSTTTSTTEVTTTTTPSTTSTTIIVATIESNAPTVGAPATTETGESTTNVVDSAGPVPSDLQWAKPERNYLYPIPNTTHSGYQGTHSGYPATDVFASCGAPIVAPVHGTVNDLRRVDPWDPSVDDPFTRGGKFVSILGVDGVRYYLAHFTEIAESITVGASVVPGQYLGSMGTTGRSSACHLHFSISPPCPNDEWWVRRGVIWPYTYFDSWRSGEESSPVDAVQQWLLDNPNGCETQ